MLLCTSDAPEHLRHGLSRCTSASLAQKPRQPTHVTIIRQNIWLPLNSWLKLSQLHSRSSDQQKHPHRQARGIRIQVLELRGVLRAMSTTITHTYIYNIYIIHPYTQYKQHMLLSDFCLQEWGPYKPLFGDCAIYSEAIVFICRFSQFL